MAYAVHNLLKKQMPDEHKKTQKLGEPLRFLILLSFYFNNTDELINKRAHL